MSLTLTRPAIPALAPDRLTPGAIAAYVTLCLVWGSTFLAVRIAVETLPPFTLSGMRSLIAGAILASIALARGAALPSRAALVSAAVSGMLMFSCCQAVLSWAETRVPSGLTAVMACTVSLFTPVISWLAGASPRPGLVASLGLMAGFAGVAVLVPSGGPHALDGLAVTALLVSSLAWSVGAALARRVPPAGSPLLGSGVQLLCGGVLTVCIASLNGEWQPDALAHASARSVFAMVYLIGFGSLLSVACFGWLVQIWRPERLSTYAYVNPVIALALGAAFAGEAVSARELLATVFILCAVALVMVSMRHQNT
jgi:drug/metabolite transporter (DMT)-like permease